MACASIGPERDQRVTILTSKPDAAHSVLRLMTWGWASHGVSNHGVVTPHYPGSHLSAHCVVAPAFIRCQTRNTIICAADALPHLLMGVRGSPALAGGGVQFRADASAFPLHAR